MLERRIINSRTLGERRPYRVLLPPGYAGAPEPHYPVLYFHDGQAVFNDDRRVLASLHGGCWPALDPAGARMRSLMEATSLRPAIVVAVDALSLETRIRDYLTPGDSYLGVDGAADRYAQFLIDELKPAIDREFRTYPQRETTVTAGFSFGGLVALYLAWQHQDRFCAAGSISGAFWASRLSQRIAVEKRRDLRLYLDSGDDNFLATAALSRCLQARGYVLDRDIRYQHRRGHTHRPGHFAAALAPMLAFLLPPLPVAHSAGEVDQ